MADLGEMDAFARAVGHVLRSERRRRNWTLADAGLRAGLSESVVCRAESAVRSIDMMRLVQLCAALDVSPAQVIATAQAEAFPLGWPDHDWSHVVVATP